MTKLIPYLSVAENNWLQYAATSSASLSLVGSLYIIISYLLLKYKTKYIRIDFTKDLIFVLAWMDLLGAFARIFGHDFSEGLCCQIQAFSIEFADIGPVIWNTVIAVNMYWWVNGGSQEETLRGYFKWYLSGTMTISLGICIAGAIGGIYDTAGLWCWVGDQYVVWRFAVLYIWVVLAALIITVVLILVRKNVVMRVRRQHSSEALTSSSKVINKSFLYTASFVFLWLPCLIDRTVSVFFSANFSLMFLHALFVPLQGFVNAIIYGGMHETFTRLIKSRWGSLEDCMTPNEWNCGRSEKSSFSEKKNESTHCSGKASIFVTTFNMNRSEIPSNLSAWIPANHDIYVISVQQCIALHDLRRDLQKHLEKINCMSFSSFVAEMKTNLSFGPKNSFIGQLVFVRKAEVESGLFSLVSGTLEDVGASTYLFSAKSNRGAIGMSIRYFDVTLALVNCRLSSSYKGRSLLKRRNREAADLIRNLRLEVDDVGFDFPLLYHHTILLGEFNYQLVDIDCRRILSMIHVAATSQDHKQQSEDALRRCFNLQMIPYLEESCSSTSLQDYELEVVCSGMDDGVAFTFVESPPSKEKFNCIQGEIQGEIIQGEIQEKSSFGKSFLDVILPTENLSDEDVVSSKLNRLVETAQNRDDESRQYWQNLLSFDELCQAMLKYEIFCGFREADITFPPSYRRKRGVVSTMSDLTEREKLEGSYQTSNSRGYSQPPSYSDRILVHSLPDLKDNIKTTDYWLCEEIITSDHKPVCSVIELEVDRLFQGGDPSSWNLTLSSSSSENPKLNLGVKEYTIHLSSLSSQIWKSSIDQTSQSSIHRTMTDSNGSLQQYDSEMSEIRDMHLSSPKTTIADRSYTTEKDSMISHGNCQGTCDGVKCSSTCTSVTSAIQDAQQIPPMYITTMFPLPSEDIFSYERKLHEVADSFGFGFSRSESENRTYMSNSVNMFWKVAVKKGIEQSAFIKSMKGKLHMAIKIVDDRGHGGQGVLGINDSMIEAKEPLPFDIPLSYGGQYVGYVIGRVFVTVC